MDAGHTMEGDATTRRANLTGAKEARKRAELDAQLLANRIALLKQEEEKAWKKIEETRKRANEITTMRGDNEQKYIAKEKFYKQKWESIRTAQQHNAYMREQNKEAKAAVAKSHVEAKGAYVRNAKLMAHENLMEKKQKEANERAMNEQRAQYIKKQKDEANRRMEAERQARLLQYQQDYEARCSEEEMLRARTEALVAKMEKEEMDLIQRLQNTQTVQRNAYEELETALGSTGAKGRGEAKPRPAA